MFSNASGILIQGGTLINYSNPTVTKHTSRGTDLLMEWVATGAFHNSDELYDAPKCHPHTRVAVLEDIMNWVNKSESAEDDFILWLFGPAGAGKSAIAKRIAEITAERDLLIGDFFFARTSPTRGTKDRLIPTLAYQLALSLPDTKSCIEDAIERDPAIFKKNIQTQIDTLLIKPFQTLSSTHIVPSQKLIIIDGLDECNDSNAQVAILEAISRSFTQHNLPIKFLIVSRPEIHLVTLFTSQEPLKSIHRRLALDDTYQPNEDIRLFFSDRFKQIRLTHPLKTTIPISWPTQEMLKTLVRKSSGQFIYASTVVKFVESICHQPSARLNIILGVSPPGKMTPFAELDSLYIHLLSSVDDIQITLRVLSFYVMTPKFAFEFSTNSHMSPELFLSLEPGDIHLSLINLSSIVTYDELYHSVTVLHASLVDFLSDKHRSTCFYIDMASTCTGFVRCILQYVKGPDGIQAGNFDLLRGVTLLGPHTPRGQLRNDILNFDLDAFINASISWLYKEHYFVVKGSTLETYDIWERFLRYVDLEDGDKEEALGRLAKSFESRFQIYQSDWRLQLLLTLAVANVIPSAYWQRYRMVPNCRYVDILLELDDHDLLLIDQNALDLRHMAVNTYMMAKSRLVSSSSYANGDAYASAALHCMRFLSNPPKHSNRNESPEMGLIYAEWKATCAMTLDMLCKLLRLANTLPDLVKFFSDHDIYPAVQSDLSADRIWKVNAHILAFLSRANLCPNWRIISAIQRSLIVPNSQSSKFEKDGANFDDEEDEELGILHLVRERVAECCWRVH